MLSMISTHLIPLPHAPSPLIQQTSFCYSKSSWSYLLKSTHAAFLLITWKSIFRRGVVLWSHLRDYSFNGLNQFFSFLLILSDHFRLQTVRRFSMRTHLSHNFHHFTKTHVCLMANLMPSNLTLFLTVHFCAMHGYAATHMRITHVMLLFHSATAMRLHHVFNLRYACPRQYR